MAINLTKPAEFTDTDIQAFETKPENKSRGKVKVVEFDTDEKADGTARFFIAKPNRQQLEMIASTSQSGGVTKVNDLMVNTGVLAGDLDLLANDDALFFGLLEEISALNEVKKKR